MSLSGQNAHEAASRGGAILKGLLDPVRSLGSRAQPWLEGWRWLGRPYAYFEERAHVHGRTNWAQLPGLGRVLLTGEPQVVGQIATHPDLVGGRAHRALRAALGEDHLIVLWGEAHRRRRRLLFPILHNYSDDELVVDTTRQVMDGLRPGLLSMKAVVHEISLKIALRALLGRLPESAEERILVQVRRFQRSFSNPLNLYLGPLRRDWGRWSPWGRLVSNRALLMQSLVEQVGNSPQGLGAVLADGLEPAALPWELLALLMFGHETTAGAMAWCLAHLAVHPEARGPIREGDEAYILAYVEESLRMCPAVAQLTRVAERDTLVGGQAVPEGTTVMPCISLSHQDSQAFPEPTRFCPQRFLGQSPRPMIYYPFGLGNRICPGRALALRQMVLMLKTIVGGWDLTFPAGYQPRPVRELFLVVPYGGTPMRLG